MLLWIICFLIAAGVGISCGITLARRLLRNSSHTFGEVFVKENIESILKSAEVRRNMILDEARSAAKEQYAAESAQLELDREVILHLQENIEHELSAKQSEVDKFANTLDKKAEELTQSTEVVTKLQEQIQKTETQHQEIQNLYQTQLETKIGQKKSELFQTMAEEVIHSEKIGITRWLMENGESLKADAQKFARNSLASVYLRYQPTFVWPKSSFVVTLPSKELLQKHFFEESPLVKLLVADTSTLVSSLEVQEAPASMLKITGGAGIDKEMIRLTLEDMISHNIFEEERVKLIIKKHKTFLDKTVLKMGDEAIRALGLKPVHLEIAKLIGSLNYRTSHRQNQYFHSMEVSRLAGMIAQEVGVDPILAKRAGILHDIGKALDYKIEGSHAVISGDYATRFGEAEDVVDTVLAHHDDKIVETPHAYILKAADAMSGARPGARVDMEEGYHRRIDGISSVVNSFQEQGVSNLAIMHAGREVHVFVDNNRIKEQDIAQLAKEIATKLEDEVEYPGQIKVTVIRRTEISAVA